LYCLWQWHVLCLILKHFSFAFAKKNFYKFHKTWGIISVANKEYPSFFLKKCLLNIEEHLRRVCHMKRYHERSMQFSVKKSYIDIPFMLFLDYQVEWVVKYSSEIAKIVKYSHGILKCQISLRNCVMSVKLSLSPFILPVMTWTLTAYMALRGKWLKSFIY
jgi:hypothetical protein